MLATVLPLCTERPVDDEAADTRQVIEKIKAKEFASVAEVAQLMGCSNSHVRNLVEKAIADQATYPIPFADLDGVRVFPVQELLQWTRIPKPKVKETSTKRNREKPHLAALSHEAIATFNIRIYDCVAPTRLQSALSKTRGANMIREKKKGERFFRFEFMEGGKRISGTLNGKKGLPFVASKQEARDRESEIRIQVRTQLRQGTFGREVGLEDFGTFFDKVFMPYAKEHKASWRHDEFRGEVLKRFFAGKTFGEITPMLLSQYINMRLTAFSKRKALFDPTTIYKEVALASSIFNMAIREGEAQLNPCRLIPTAIKKKLPARNRGIDS